MEEDSEEFLKDAAEAQGRCNCGDDEIIADPELEKRSPQYTLYAIVGIIVIFGLIFSFNYLRDTKFVRTGLTGNTIKATEDTYTYKGHEFANADGIWYTDIRQGNTIYSVGFHYDPLSVRDIDIQGKLSESFLKSEVYYVTFDPTKENLGYTALASAELQLSMARAMRLPLKAACTTNHTQCKGVPIITCTNTDKPVFYINEAEETKVLFNKNCITIEGKGEELIKAVDRLLYFWYGIMG